MTVSSLRTMRRHARDTASPIMARATCAKVAEQEEGGKDKKKDDGHGKQRDDDDDGGGDNDDGDDDGNDDDDDKLRRLRPVHAFLPDSRRR